METINKLTIIRIEDEKEDWYSVVNQNEEVLYGSTDCDAAIQWVFDRLNKLDHG